MHGDRELAGDGVLVRSGAAGGNAETRVVEEDKPAAGFQASQQPQ